MPDLSVSLLDLLTGMAVFGLVLGLWLIVLLAWLVRRTARALRVEQRLGLSAEGAEGGDGRVLRLWHEDREQTTEVPGLGRRRRLRERLARFTRDAELSVPVTTIILGLAGVSGLLFVLLLLATGSPLPGLGAVAVLGASATVYLRRRASQRLARFERQFVDAMDLAARSLRAGHPILGAFRLIAEEVPPPVSTVFAEICQQQALGRGLAEALRWASDESARDDLKLFATSVIIQMRSGGSLADMMERIADVIRDRMRLSRRIRVLTAQTELSKRILIALPTVMFLFLNIVNPRYVSTFYTTTAGQVLLCAAGAGILLGWWVMSRLVVLRY
ncbi:MAG: type II secretion system F family protein [Planctomycetes bacterium]|nr:type II secretion system F family protein [Planctomycetota bacterium]